VANEIIDGEGEDRDERQDKMEEDDDRKTRRATRLTDYKRLTERPYARRA
jgi:hypothetical protein